MADHPGSRNRRRVIRNTKQTTRTDGLVWDKNAMQFVEKDKMSKEPTIIIPKGIPDFLY